jgi:hypothetical protein
LVIGEKVRRSEASQDGADDERKDAQHGGQISMLPETASAESLSDGGSGQVYDGEAEIASYEFRTL